MQKLDTSNIAELSDDAREKFLLTARESRLLPRVREALVKVLHGVGHDEAFRVTTYASQMFHQGSAKTDTKIYELLLLEERWQSLLQYIQNVEERYPGAIHQSEEWLFDPEVEESLSKRPGFDADMVQMARLLARTCFLELKVRGLK